VRGRVLLVVGLDLDDRAPRAVEEELGADQLGRDLVDAAVEEVAREGAGPLAAQKSCSGPP
jgi:hypothetical protein